MTEQSDTQPFLGIPKDDGSQKPAPVYYDRSSTPTMRWIVGSTLSFIILTLVISIILIIVQTAKVNVLFILLLISLIAFAQVEFFLVFFIYKGKVPRKHLWSIFVVGTFVVVECICTVIVIFNT